MPSAKFVEFQVDGRLYRASVSKPKGLFRNCHLQVERLVNIPCYVAFGDPTIHTCQTWVHVDPPHALILLDYALNKLNGAAND